MKVSVKNKKSAKKGIESVKSQLLLQIYMWLTVFLVVFPFLITVMFSLKGISDFDKGFWTVPSKLHFENYMYGFLAVSIEMLNSLIVCVTIAVVSVGLSAFVSYVFCRHEFYGKEFLFLAIMALMIVPGVISLTPSYLNIQQLGINNTWFAVILPGITGSQVGSIFLFRTFMGQHPKELYESMDIDGAGDFTKFFNLALPLAVPILIVQLLGIFSSTYNDYLWPMLVIQKKEIQLLMPTLKNAIEDAMAETGNPGTSYAMYLVSGIPLLISSSIGLKYFISGDFASGMKL